ncbi:MAG: protein jag [Ruminococcus sp.]|nr:protein jag [Ruminococcus sp.]
MKKEFTAATVEEAKSLAAAEFGTAVENISFTVLEEPKKSFFGKLKGEARIEAEYEAAVTQETVKEEVSATTADQTEAVIEAPAQEEPEQEIEWTETAQKKADCAKEYLVKVITAMGIENAEIETKKIENGALFDIKSEEFSKLIGKKGELLDSLQYLASLVCNRIDRDYFRISCDCGDFRARRKKQLENLARKIANNVQRSGRSYALEPMNPYERRIIHAAISEIEGVVSQSKGEEPWRKVIISSTNPRKGGGRDGGYRNGGRGGRRNSRPQKAFDITTSFEKDYKKPKPEDSMKGAGLYSKIEF